MGVYTEVFKQLFEELGCNVLIPPLINQETIKLGVRHSSDMMCFPYKICLGNFIQALENGANTLIMFDSKGTCRFKHYHYIQKQILEDLGYNFEMHVINRINFLRFFKKINPNLSYLKIMKEIRNYYLKIKEKEKQYYKMPENPEIKIGIIGEIYTVLEPAINYDIVNKLKRMNVGVHVSTLLSHFIKHNIGLDFDKKKEKKEAKKYLKDRIGGHGKQSIYNSIWYAKNNFDGIIHLLPLSCMPETTIEMVVDRISNIYNIPVYRFPIDENKFEAGFNTRIETFVSLLKRKKQVEQKCVII
jgi:predicted nucleotide-binding protein (sugar kinase/HSP70/actin superfamily)